MAAYGRLVPAVRRIAVLRANGIADYVLCLPALTALRAAYPRADILLLGRDWHSELLPGRPGPVNRVVVVPDDAGLSAADGPPAAPARLPFVEHMRAEAFDLALQLHDAGRDANALTRSLEARLTVGMHERGAAPLDRSLPFDAAQPEIVRCLEVVALVGAPVVTLEPRFAVTMTDLRASYATLPDDELPLAVLSPGSQDPRRRWPAAHFTAVGRALARAGARVTVSGASHERALCAEVAHGIGAEAVDVSGRLSLNGLAGLLARAAVVVGNDTGTLHLAGAIGTATVGIYWAPRLAASSPLLRHRHRPCVAWDPRCPACGVDNVRGRCTHGASFVAGVPVEEVANAALDFFHAARERRQPSLAAALA